MPEGRERRRPAIRLSVVLAVVLVLAAAPSGARQQPISTTQGHAQIIAQGVAALPAPEASWRVVYHTVEPGGPAPLPTELSFTLIDQGTLHVAAEDDRWLLGSGEAILRAAGEPASSAAYDDRPAGYYAIDLIAPVAIDTVGEGLAIYAGTAFSSPPGDRDLKLVRDVLAPEETTVITGGSEAPMLVLATLGTISVAPSDGSGPVELRVGEAAEFTGEVTVRGEGLAPASFVAAVIGREVVQPAAGTPVASPVAAGSGTVSVRLHACPADFRPGRSNPSLCPPDFNAVELTLVELLPGGDERDLGAPAAAETNLQWTNLPPGDFVLRAIGFGPGLDRFFIAGLAGTTGVAADGYPAGAEGYLVPISATDPVYQFDVYAYSSQGEPPPGTPVSAAAAAETAVTVEQGDSGAVGVRMFACPTVGLVSFDPVACVVASAPFDVSLTGVDLAAPLTLAEAVPDAGGYSTWSGLAPGTYVLQVPLMPAGTIAYFVVESPGVSLLPDSTGYAVSLDAGAEPLLIDIYAVGPEPGPPTAVPTFVPTVVSTAAPTVPAASIDSDGDGLTDEAETSIHGTNPTVWDTDGDSISDGQEIQSGTDPFTPNTGGARCPTMTATASPTPTRRPSAPIPPWPIRTATVGSTATKSCLGASRSIQTASRNRRSAAATSPAFSPSGRQCG